MSEDAPCLHAFVEITGGDGDTCLACAKDPEFTCEKCGLLWCAECSKTMRSYAIPDRCTRCRLPFRPTDFVMPRYLPMPSEAGDTYAEAQDFIAQGFDKYGYGQGSLSAWIADVNTDAAFRSITHATPDDCRLATMAVQTDALLAILGKLS